MWLLVIIALAIVAIWQYLRARNDIFKRIDVKGPTPSLLFGNLFDIKGFSFNNPMVVVTSDLMQQWTKRYGKVYGYYEGGTPVMVTSDPEIVSEIFIKQFSNFHGRKLFPGQGNPDKQAEANIFTSRGARWKRLRNISNPTFTSMKMKQMFPIINDCVNELIGILDEKCQKKKSFNFHPVFQGLTMDVIARTAFGYQTSVQANQENDKLLAVSRELLSVRKGLFNKFMIFVLLLPEVKEAFVAFFKIFRKYSKHPAMYISRQLKKVIEERKKQKSTNEGVKDFIQLMLEAETLDGHDSVTTNSGNMSNLHIDKRLTSEEIVSQSFIFIIAGFETTSTALGFVTYLLALHPEIQEKVYEEIQNTITQGQPVSYDNVQKLYYMDAVIHETLRMYPIGQSAVNRLCMTSTTINGVYIPEGMNVAVDVMSLHYNEEYWGSDVKEFNPDRFLPENAKNRNQSVYLPFGAGPRNCIGMRFALMESKLALCKVLQKFKIVTCPQTQIPIKVKTSHVVLTPENGVYIMLEERKI